MYPISLSDKSSLETFETQGDPITPPHAKPRTSIFTRTSSEEFLDKDCCQPRVYLASICAEIKVFAIGQDPQLSLEGKGMLEEVSVEVRYDGDNIDFYFLVAVLGCMTAYLTGVAATRVKARKYLTTPSKIETVRCTCLIPTKL